MPIIGATQLEPVNMLGSYVQGLEAGRAARAQRMKEAQDLAAANEEAAFRNFLTTSDLSRPEVRNQLPRFGKRGLEIAASLADVESKRASAEKTGVETSAARAKLADDNYGRFQKTLGDLAYNEAAPTKAQVLDQIDFMVAQGIVAPEFSAYAASTLPDDPAELQVKLRGQFISQIPPAERAKLFVPVSADVEEQKIRIAGAGAPRTTIQMPAAKEFAGALGKQAAARLDDFRSKAESARSTLQTSQQLLPLLDDPNFISGTLANARLAVAKAVGIDVSATESYFAGVGQQVAERITAFGAGTGLSDADREFAKKIAAGEESLSVKSIRRIIDINNRSARNVIETYNNERNRLGKKEPEVLDYYPELDTPQVGQVLSPADQEALAWANANPRDARSAEIKKRLGVQ
jgi:hypothetical protein